MSYEALVILMSVGLVVLIYVIRFLMNAAVNKAGDAIHNARVRAQAANCVPQQENLAERYRAVPGQTAVRSERR